MKAALAEMVEDKVFGTRSTRFKISKTIYPALVFLIIFVPLAVLGGEFKTELIFPLTALYAGWLLGWVVSAMVIPAPPSGQDYTSLNAVKAIQGKGLPLNLQPRFAIRAPAWLYNVGHMSKRNVFAFVSAVLMWLAWGNYYS